MHLEDDLWRRIEAFQLDVEGAKLPFCARLARDNHWTLEYALRVALEYKKFLYLACVAGHTVTPSDEVDQAWHLHLTYTRSYWDELCAQVLQRPLHHEATRGGASEGQKWENFYERTLDSYREIFKAEPPPDIWPVSEVRFGEAPHFRRVNVKRFYLLPKPRFSRSQFSSTIRIAPALTLALVLAGCSASGSLNPFNWLGAEFLTLFWGLCLIAIPFSLGMRNWLALPSDEQFPREEIDPYLMARLANSGHLPVDAALVSLQMRGLIHIGQAGQIERVGEVAPTHRFELQIWNALDGRVKLPDVRRIMHGAVARFDAELERLGLLVSAPTRRLAESWPLATALALLGFGLVKIGVGIERGRPVGFLVVSCLALLVYAVILALSEGVRRSGRGTRFLDFWRNQPRGRRLKSETGMLGDDFSGNEVVLAMALWNYQPLPSHLRRRFQPASSGDGGSSSFSGGGDCSGSDSGSSDGGGSGCGGCGGGGD
ncbi:MAG TPA: TIGR04222 domain-containing membrane protein [Abditibacterium sp.]|jgi:uncharacterized protein (TIGR04222 family)